MAKLNNEQRAEILAKVIFDDQPALSLVYGERASYIVRPMTDGNFAVIELTASGGKCHRRPLIALPTKDRAIAFNRACGR